MTPEGGTPAPPPAPGGHERAFRRRRFARPDGSVSAVVRPVACGWFPSLCLTFLDVVHFLIDTKTQFST